MIAVPRAASTPHAVPRRARGTAFAFAVLLALVPVVAAAHVPYGAPIARVETTERVIALSFDDGPQVGPVLDSLLAVLAPRHAHATFFVIGEELAAHPEIARRLLEAGHELGNHSWTHPHFDSIGVDSALRELSRNDSLLHALGARGRALVRPPYGEIDHALVAALAKRHRVVPLFDVDPSDDFRSVTSADTIVAKTVNWLGPGSILVMHPWYGNDGPALAILPRVLDWLASLGYRIVTVSELLATKHAIAEPSLYHRVE